MGLRIIYSIGLCMNKRAIRTIKAGLLYAVFFLAVYAIAAQMTLPSIPSLGGGEGTVTSPGNVVSYTWVLSGTPVQVTGATLKFDSDLDSGTAIYVTLLGSDDSPLASGSTTLPSNLSAGSPVTISVSPNVSPSSVNSITVAIVG